MSSANVRVQRGRVETIAADVDKIAIVQLSDIHFKANSNVVTSRTEKIVAALRPTLEAVDAVIFAISGDIANSGLQMNIKLRLIFLQVSGMQFKQIMPQCTCILCLFREIMTAISSRWATYGQHL